MSDDGEEVVADGVVKQNGGIGHGAYGDRSTFEAGVQFSITDPAFGWVSAGLFWLACLFKGGVFSCERMGGMSRRERSVCIRLSHPGADPAQALVRCR